MSNMEGSKALHLEALCEELGLSFTRFDYLGHGSSDGDFTDGTIGEWRNNTLQIIDELTTQPLIIIGSSMGGWMMLLAALARTHRIRALIGIAAAPDFTRELMWAQMTAAQRDTLMRDGVLNIPSDYGDAPYPISQRLIEESDAHLLLNRDAKLPLTCPIHLLHGMRDIDVPWDFSTRIAEKVESDDVTVTLLKNGDHRLSSESELAHLSHAVLGMVNKNKAI